MKYITNTEGSSSQNIAMIVNNRNLVSHPPTTTQT